jgi:WD40 repeat protein
MPGVPTPDDLLTDAAALVHADPDAVLPLLAAAATAPGRLAAAVYRTSFQRHRRVDPARRRQALALDAARFGATDLARRLDAVEIASGAAGRGAGTTWNTGAAPPGRLIRRFTGRTEKLNALATAVVEGRPIAVGASFLEGTTRVWDLATGAETRPPLPGKPTSITTTTLHGRPVAVTGELDGSLRRWDLGTGEPIGDAVRAHPMTVAAVTTTVVDGQVFLISCGYPPDGVRVWNLADGTPVGPPLNGHEGQVSGVAVTVVEGRPVLLTASPVDHTVRVWDLIGARQLGEPLESVGGAVATAVVDGRPVAVTGGRDDTVRVWDLIDRRPVGPPLVGHVPASVDVAVVEGRPVAVTAGYADRLIRIWDLAAGVEIEALPGHFGHPRSVAFAHLAGGPVAVSTDGDGVMLLWDADPAGVAGAPPTRPEPARRWCVDWATGSGLTGAAMSMPGHGCRVLAAGSLDGRPVVVAGGQGDEALRVLDPVTGDRVGAPVPVPDKQVGALAVTTLDGRTVAVTAGYGPTVSVSDLADGSLIGELAAIEPPADAIATSVGALAVTDLDGRRVLLSGGGARTLDGDTFVDTACEVRVWDLAERREYGHPLVGHTAPVHAIAVTELDGRPVALTASGSFRGVDCTVRLWDLVTRRQIGTLTGHTGEVTAVAAATVDGRPVAVTLARDHTARTWDLATGAEIHRLPHGPVLCVTELDGRPVALIGDGIHDLSTGDRVGSPFTSVSTSVEALVALRIDGRPVVVSGDGDAVLVWDLSADAPAASPPAGAAGAITRVAVTEIGGREVVAAAAPDAGLAHLWDAADGAPVGGPVPTGSVSGLAAARIDDQPVLVGARHGDVVVWNLPDGTERTRFATDHHAEILALAVGVDGTRQVVLTGTYDHAVAAHVLTTGARVGRRRTSLHYEAVRAAAVTTDDRGRVLAVTAGGSAAAEIKVWQLRNGGHVAEPRVGHSDDVNAVAVLALDGRPVAVTAGRDRSVRVWHVRDGSPALPPFHGHTAEVQALAAAVLDGRPTVVSGGDDRTVRVWDLAGGADTELVFPEPVAALALTPSGRLVVCFGRDVAVLSRRWPGRRWPGRRWPGRRQPGGRQPAGTRGRTSCATKRTKPSGSGSSGVGWSTTVSAPASARSRTAAATACASPTTDLSAMDS